MKTMMTLAAVIVLSLSPLQAATIDFDGLSAGDTVTVIDGVTFSSNVPGLDLVVSTGFDTTSPDNYLGIDDPFSGDVFLGGDEIYLDFGRDAGSLRVNFISAGPAEAGDFSIITSSGTAANAAVEDRALPDGGLVYAISFASATPFNSAVLSSIFALTAFNIDDIAIDILDPVPEPGTAVLMLFGMLLFLNRRRS